MEKVELSYKWSPWLEASYFPWEQVLHLGSKKRYTKNCVILGNGEFVKELHYLHRGKVKLVSVNSQGEEKILWYISSGSIFGEVPFVDRNKSYSYFISEEDCIVYTFTRRIVMEKILPNYPDIMMNTLETLTKKVRILTSQINDLTLNTPKIRTYKMLYHLFSTNNNSELCITQQELANLLGIHRVTLNQILVHLKKQGIIQQDSRKKRIIVDKPSELLKLIDQEQFHQ